MGAVAGMKGLAITRASQLAVQRHAGKTGPALSASVAASIPAHLADDLKAGREFAAEAVRVLRTSPALPPNLSDDEVADMVLARIRERT